jgi:hypothetical protein
MIPNPQTRHHGSFLLGRVWLRLTPDIPRVGDCFVDVAEFVATVFRQNQAIRFWQNLGARSGCPVKSAPVRTTDIAMHLHGARSLVFERKSADSCSDVGLSYAISGRN